MAMIQTGALTLNSAAASVTEHGKTTTFRSVTFPTPFPEGSNVVVVPMVQTFNGANTPGLRVADVTTTGFKIRMNELVVSQDGQGTALSDGAHPDEVVGWVAFTA